jgi:hypothetical protein
MALKVRAPDEVQLNLIPIMNLFTTLIPFLLMSAVFFRLSIIQITVPVASETGETDIAKEEDKITLNLQIFADRFELSASSDTLEPEKVKALRATIDRKALAGEAAYAKLSEEAYRIKGKYTGSDTAIVVPESDVAYEDVVGAIDAARDIRLVKENNARVVLFPKVVLSSRVK